MKPVIVFDNIIYSLQKAGGISAFWSELTRRVTESELFDCRFIEYKGSENNIFRKKLQINPENIISGKRFPFDLQRVLEPYIPPSLTQKPFIFHSSYYRIYTHPRVINVSTFHDLTHEHGGDGNFLTRPMMRAMHANALRKSEHIICVSNHCLKDVKSMFPRETFSKSFSVAYNATVNCLQTGKNEQGDFLLFVGARDDYKHFFYAVDLARKCGLSLKVAGAPFTKRELQKIGDSNVENYPYPSDVEMEKLFRGARALVFMSEYEGFGIPLVEAQAYGCPVIALRRSAVPEVVGEGAMLLEDFDLEKGTEIVEKLKNSEFRKNLILRGKKNATRFSWEKTSEHYMEIYSRLLNL